MMQHQILCIRSAFKKYAVEKTKLKKPGKMIGEIDMLIASTALAHEMVLVTRNTKHFQRIENLQLENWIDEEPTT
ncbi:MAG: type II toxin-antitoxin system VapC family toxin [Microscillaceae bacterium]|nr:type II toxin-antitoxin system VapC family toxin [Microscillaceae bacterium]